MAILCIQGNHGNPLPPHLPGHPHPGHGVLEAPGLQPAPDTQIHPGGQEGGAGQLLEGGVRAPDMAPAAVGTAL